MTYFVNWPHPICISLYEVEVICCHSNLSASLSQSSLDISVLMKLSGFPQGGMILTKHHQIKVERNYIHVQTVDGKALHLWLHLLCGSDHSGLSIQTPWKRVLWTHLVCRCEMEPPATLGRALLYSIRVNVSAPQANYGAGIYVRLFSGSMRS